MGLFNKNKKIKNEYNETFNKMNQEDYVKSSDKIVFMEPKNNSDLMELATQLKNHNPIIVNFAEMDYETANRGLAFLSGAVYVLGGRFEKLNDQIYLFAQKEEFLDGSLREFINNL